MGFLSVLSMAHRLVSERVQAGEACIDATVGNGHDTLFLARLVGPGGTVYGFDIQEQAIASASARIRSELGDSNPVQLLHASHSSMREALPPELEGRIAAFMFNLGYLPGGNHSVITGPATTMPAMDAALSLLRPGGVLTAVLYPGHAGGREEAEAVDTWAGRLPQLEFQSLRYGFLNYANNPPYLISIERR